MNKLSLALALGTGLAVGGLAPARAATLTSTSTSATTPVSEIQTLSTADMSASQFNALFTPIKGVNTSTIDFAGATGAGTLSSQVFSGGSANGVDATGLYAYAYQVSLNNTTNASGEPVHIDGSSWQFNSTPSGSNLTGNGTDFAYLISNGSIGGLGMPTSGAPAPTISWQSGQNIGSILATFANGSSDSAPLSAGTTSGTFVVLSTQPPASNFQLAGVLSSDPQTSAPTVFSPSAGSVSPIPIPEPTTVLAWAGMAGAVALARRARKARVA
jgi:hypothetical protein